MAADASLEALFNTEPEVRGAHPDIQPLDERELASLIEQELHDAAGGLGTEVSERSRENLAMYQGKPIGNEKVGRSQVILTDVADTVEWIMPSLMRMFFGGDQVVRYKPTGEDDEEGAAQASDYMNQVFLHSEEGFSVGLDWMKTALIERNSHVFPHYEEKHFPEITELKQITEIEIRQILQDNEVEIMEATPRDDELPVQDLETGELRPMRTYDCTFRRIKEQKRIRVEAIPPEQFLVARRDVRMDDETSFACIKRRMTVSDLISLGVDPEVALNLPSYDATEYLVERLERYSDDNSYPGITKERADAVSRQVWVNNCFLRVDYDGDGYLELRNVLCAGDSSVDILWNDYYSHMPFADLCAVPLPHRYFGLTVADLVKDLQVLRSTLLRQMMDNIYLQNDGRYTVLEGQADLEALLDSLPGGIIPVTSQDAVKVLETPILPSHSFAMLEYLEGVKEQRTGITRYNQGTDASSLNKTAFGIGAIMEAANARIELIARIFSERGGFKRLFKILLRLMKESPIKEQVVKLRGKWVTVDPSTWNPDWEVEIEMGLGLGQAQQRIAMLKSILEAQLGVINHGGKDWIVTPENTYNALHELQVTMGWRAKNHFFTDPAEGEPPPPPPNPDMEKIKQAESKAARDSELKAEEIQVDGARIQQDGEIRTAELALKRDLEMARIASDEKIAAMKIDADLEKARITAAAQRAAKEKSDAGSD